MSKQIFFLIWNVNQNNMFSRLVQLKWNRVYLMFVLFGRWCVVWREHMRFFGGTKSALHVCPWSCCYSNRCRGEAYITCNLCFRNKKHQISAVIYYNICRSPHPGRKTDTVSYPCVSKCQTQNNVQVGLGVLASTVLNSKLCSVLVSVERHYLGLDVL